MGKGVTTVLTIALGLPSGSIIANADTLMKGKHPVVIGRATLTGSRIEWTDCDRTKSAKYVNPPYWIIKNGNCDMTPQAFGIDKREDLKYVVVDPKIFGEYFPGARKGDEVFFERQANGIVLRTNGQRLELHSAIWEENESGSQKRRVEMAEARWEGVVTRSNKDNSSLTVRNRDTNVEKTVRYDSSTQWTSQEHQSKMVNNIDASQVKDDDRVICLGTWGKDGALQASSCSKRLSR